MSGEKKTTSETTEDKAAPTPASILAEIEAIATAIANIVNIVSPIIGAFTTAYKKARTPKA